MVKVVMYEHLFLQEFLRESDNNALSEDKNAEAADAPLTPTAPL